MSLDVPDAFAQWADRATLVWNTALTAGARCALEYAAVATAGDVLAGGGNLIHLTPIAGGLPPRLRDRYPHLAASQAFEVGYRDAAQLREALRSVLLATKRDDEGRVLAATGVQAAGVLDDLFAAAATAQLGPTWRDGVPQLAVWAPTARSVTLNLYAAASGGQYDLVAMRLDRSTGIWSVTGQPAWRDRYYTFVVTVYAASANAIVRNEVTDPYSLSLSADSLRSQLVDLGDPRLAPANWPAPRLPDPVPPDQACIYELHIRDFSASDATVPEPRRGTYSAFTVRDSAGMRELRDLAASGLTHVQLMPAFDFATVPDRVADRLTPACDLASFPPDSDRQQECIAAISTLDAFDWGYAPLHYSVPEGSYATDPDGWVRIIEFRRMVQALHDAGLLITMDVVYNHTHAALQEKGSVLDRIVPGYYQRLRDDGTVSTGTACLDAAPEHLMMGKLVIDSMATWAMHYSVDGFRIDLMGFHPRQNILAVRGALDAIGAAAHRTFLLYGEGWNFGDVADDTRFIQATQRNMAGTGIGTFNDRLRDAVRGGGVLDTDPRAQGFGSGLYTAPNGAAVNGTADAQRARLLSHQATIEVGLTGNLSSYPLTRPKTITTQAQAGYNAEPGEAITYVDCHDNLTLFDSLALKLPQDISLADRVRMQSLCLAIVLLGQGGALILAGSERLRSKSLDRNSYNSGDWFNRLLWDCREGNGFGAGLPPAPDNRAHWPYDRPLLADPALRPDCAAIDAARAQFKEFLRIRRSSPGFSLGSAAEIRRRMSFPPSGTADDPAGTPGVIRMRIDTAGLDKRWTALFVTFNATGQTCVQEIQLPDGDRIALHPVQATSHDPVVRLAAFDPVSRTLAVPARTAAVFTQTQE